MIKMTLQKPKGYNNVASGEEKHIFSHLWASFWALKMLALN